MNLPQAVYSALAYARQVFRVGDTQLLDRRLLEVIEQRLVSRPGVVVSGSNALPQAFSSARVSDRAAYPTTSLKLARLETFGQAAEAGRRHHPI